MVLKLINNLKTTVKIESKAKLCKYNNVGSLFYFTFQFNLPLYIF